MRELALHLLDIAENSISAGAQNIKVSVLEDSHQDRLKMTVQDDGKGMSPEILAQVTDPFFTSRTTRKVGLGLPLLKEAAEACQGSLSIQSEPGLGTSVKVEFQRSHIDRMPLGSLASTFLALLVSAPQVHWLFNYTLDGMEYSFDSQPVMEVLGEVSLTEPSILAYLRETITQGIAEVLAAAQPVSL
jgi:anti-sigma regulatory factor (Ser/Thr protein kinase)